jgi:hypothetical protein
VRLWGRQATGEAGGEEPEAEGADVVEPAAVEPERPAAAPVPFDGGDPPRLGDTTVHRVLPTPHLPRLSRSRRPAAPFTMRRRRRSRGGPLVFALVLVAAFVGVAFAIGYVVGRMLL